MNRFTIDEKEGLLFVYDNELNKQITKECPKEIAEEIADDFNKMNNKDYSPINKK